MSLDPGARRGSAVCLPAEQNPLRCDRIHGVAFQFGEGSWEEHLERLRQLRYRAAILGDHGRGKSTLLRELETRLPRARLLEVPWEPADHGPLLEQARRLEQAGHALLVDGLERLRWRDRQRLWSIGRRAAGLVVTVHRRCRLPVWIHCRTTADLLHRLLDQLGLDQAEHRRAAEAALSRCDGNVRDMLRLLYDELAMGRLPWGEVPASQAGSRQRSRIDVMVTSGDRTTGK